MSRWEMKLVSDASVRYAIWPYPRRKTLLPPDFSPCCRAYDYRKRPVRKRSAATTTLLRSARVLEIIQEASWRSPDVDLAAGKRQKQSGRIDVHPFRQYVGRYQE